MKSTQWLTTVAGLFGTPTTFAQAFDYENFANNQQQQQAAAGPGNGQGAPVQNSWSSDDLGYSDQDGYELPVQSNSYEQQLQRLGQNNNIDPQQAEQQYNDYMNELQSLQSMMEQGYGANQEMNRNNGQADYSDMNGEGQDPNQDPTSYYNIDYNGLDYPATPDSSPESGQETYPSPPNPCPKGVKAKNCIKDMPDTAEYSQMYQALNKNGVSKMNANMLNTFFQTV